MKLFYKIFMKFQKIKFGTKLKLKGLPIIINKGQMKIGNNVVIKSSIFSNLIGLYQKTIIVSRTPNSTVDIGNNVGISGATIYARKKIVIGSNTLVGANTKIIDNDFHPLKIEDRNNNALDKIGTKEIIIGENCFIGCNAIILKGTVLGDGCVVGAGAVVSGKFDNNSIIVGNPGRVIKK